MPLVTRTARRRFVGTLAILGTAMALMTAAAAVPARADQRDLARGLAAIAAIAIIAKIAEGRDRDDDDGRPRPHDPRPPHHGYDRKVLPVACAVDLRHRYGGIWYGESCLRRSGVEGRLPSRCAEDIRVRGRTITVLPERCLIDAGFRPARWRDDRPRHERPWHERPGD